MISLDDMRPAWRRPAGAQQRRLPLWQERLAEIIDLAKNLDDPIQHHRLHYSAMAAYLKKLFSHNPLVARKPLIRVIELRKLLTVEAEALQTAAGNMCGTVMRGTAAPPESETSSSRQGSCRNLGDLRPLAAAKAVPGRFGKARSQSRTGRSEESDGCRVPMKPRTTSADGLMTESVEGRRPVEGRARANACPGHSAGTGMSPTA